jgi:hypothetical protein
METACDIVTMEVYLGAKRPCRVLATPRLRELLETADTGDVAVQFQPRLGRDTLRDDWWEAGRDRVETWAATLDDADAILAELKATRIVDTCFLVVAGRGCNCFGAGQETKILGAHADFRTAAASAWASAKRGWLESQRASKTADASPASKAADASLADVSLADVSLAAFPPFDRDDSLATYEWGGECDTGPAHEVYVMPVPVFP